MSLNLNTIHSVNDITCLQRQELRSTACGREKTVTVFWWNPHIDDIIVISEFREEPAVCERTVKIQAASQMEHLAVHADHYQTPSKPALIATLSAVELWSQSSTPPPQTHTHTSKMSKSALSFHLHVPPSDKPPPRPPSWLMKQEGFVTFLIKQSITENCSKRGNDAILYDIVTWNASFLN